MIAWSTISWAWINNIFHVRKPSRIDQDTKWRLSLPLNMLASFSFQSWLFEQQSQTIPYFCWPTSYPSLYISSPSSASQHNIVFNTTMSSTTMSSQLVFLCMVLVSLAIILQGVSAARDLTHTMHGNESHKLPWVHTDFWHWNWYNSACY